MKVIQLLRSSPFGIEGSHLLCFIFQLFKLSLPMPTAEFRIMASFIFLFTTSSHAMVVLARKAITQTVSNVEQGIVPATTFSESKA